MLIPNKFNGYSRDGIRKYYIDGGIGEAALLGAAMGGGSAAITGGDPLKGALMGGLTGGAMSGIGGALSGAMPGTTAALTPEVAQAANVAAQTPLTASTAGTTLGQTAGANLGSLGAGSPASISAGNFGSSMLTAPSAATTLSNAAPELAQSGLQAGASATPGISALPPAQVAAPGAVGPTSFQQAIQDPSKYIMDNKFKMGAAALAGATGGRRPMPGVPEYNGVLKRFHYDPSNYRPSMYAEGGITTLASGGYDRQVGEDAYPTANMAHGGIANLGSYSDGGQMLRGPGDGMSDNIPATIGGQRPARLADGEFVVPADVVSHLGNGSTDAGAKQLYAMMNKVRQARTGKVAQGKQIKPAKYMPA
jgi:hypothetical protein